MVARRKAAAFVAEHNIDRRAVPIVRRTSSISLSHVKDTFQKYSSTDTDTYFQKYSKYVFEYLEKNYSSINTNTFKKYLKILSNTFFFNVFYLNLIHKLNH